MSSADPVLSIEDLHVHFEQSNLFGLRTADTIKAVDGVSLDIMEDDIVVLVGESGCGKTTLGKAAIGLHRPTQGAVHYRGQDIWESKDETTQSLGFLNRSDVDIPYSEIRRSLQMVHQDPGSSLNKNYTVESLLSDPLKKWEPGMELADRRERIYGLLEYVGMEPAKDYASRYPHQLSGGEQQRVALIRALLLSPDLILADEAVSALDVSLRIDIMDLMLDLQSEIQTSYLFISHNLSNARYLAEKGDGRIAVMYLGKIVEIGTPDEIIRDPQHPYTKVLRWASGDMMTPRTTDSPPLRGLDVPDPADPPSGCSFHDRCPRAREACTSESPLLFETGGQQQAACFRVHDDHEYWESPPLEDTSEDPDLFKR